MPTIVGPPPLHEPIADDAGILSHAWREWYWRLLKTLGGAQAGTWDGIDLTNSDLNDLVTKNHNDLDTISGGATADYYHLTQEQHSGLTATKTLTNTDSPYTVLATDGILLCDCSSGAITVNLPAVATSDDGRRLDIKKIDSSANAVTVDGNSAETIDDSTTIVLSDQYNSITIITDQTEWWII